MSVNESLTILDLTLRPLVSVVIPVYNAATHLYKCIESIREQGIQNIEIIIVDDGSTDQSKIINSHFQKIDKRIKIIEKENEGVSKARNDGLKIATGEWIYFCDADDTLTKDCLRILLAQTGEGIDLVNGAYNCIENDQLKRIRRQKDCIVSSKQFAQWLFQRPDGQYYGYLWTKLFRRSIIIENDITFDPTIRINEDRKFIMDYLLKCKGECKVIAIPVYNYYIRSGSAMRSINSKEGHHKFMDDLTSNVDILNGIKLWNEPKLEKYIKKTIFDSCCKNKALIKKYSENPWKDHYIVSEILKKNFSILDKIHFSALRTLGTIKGSVYQLLLRTHLLNIIYFRPQK